MTVQPKGYSLAAGSLNRGIGVGECLVEGCVLSGWRVEGVRGAVGVGLGSKLG